MGEKKTPDLSHLPVRPGCYLFKDKEGGVLYIGKAVNLKNRVRSYFHKSASHTQRIQVMVSLARSVDFTVTASEVEALILENNLIKEQHPRFNVMLRDDKTYPYLKLTVNEKFPRLFVVRKVLKDGAEYFGPYVSGKSVKAVRLLIHKIFPLRISRDSLDNAPLRRPCLNYQMKRCLAPCAGKVSEAEYREMTERVAKFLRGRDAEVVRDLKEKMREVAERQEFERAAVIRDQLSAIADLHEKQAVDAAGGRDEDYIAGVCEGGAGTVRIMMVRSGKLTGDQNFTFRKADDPAELVGAFIQQFYNSSFAVPSQVLVNVMPPDAEVIEAWLTGQRGSKARVAVPSRGRKKNLLDMAVDNARLNLTTYATGREARKEALGEIRDIVGLEEWPAAMEAVDISNISGTSAVGSLVVFFNGEPEPKEYKRFKVAVTGPDDYAMMAEVVRRRFKRLSAEGGKFPDILLVDGGAGQVSAARKALEEYAPDQAVIGVAKGEERENSATDRFLLYGQKEPLPFGASSPGRFMLQRLRDEAHRFAVAYHRKTRDKAAFASEVDGVRGFGPKRKKLLLKKYGSLKAAKGASVEDIAKTLSVSEELAVAILEKL